MLLRSITKHVKEQNWFAVTLDFVIVVVGILIAFQITSWNEDRAAGVQEAQTLQALKVDLEVTRPELQRQMRLIKEDQQARDLLADYVDGKLVDVSIVELDKLVWLGMWRFGYAEPTVPTLEELKSPGMLSQLGSIELRRALLELDTQLNMYRTNYKNVFETFYSFGDPFLIANYDLRGVFREHPGRAVRPGMGMFDPNRNRGDISALRSREFANLLIYRSALVGDIADTLVDLEMQYVELLVQIDARICELSKSCSNEVNER
ncbi:hypothetical protein N8855_00965 [bacterium]|nr:hypothetical protein [bacterium]